MREKTGQFMQDSSDRRANGFSNLVENALRWAGALLSVGLLLGIVYWSFMLGQREATEVPVIRAMAGLPRILPDDPGGAVADYQGLEVNSVLGSDESGRIDTETTLAPESGALSAEDRPMSTLAEMARNEAEDTARATAEALAEIASATAEPVRVPPSTVLVEVDGNAVPLSEVRDPTAPQRVQASSMLVETTEGLPDEDATEPEPVENAQGMTTPLRRPASIGSQNISETIDDLILMLEPEEGDTSEDMVPLLRPSRQFGNPTILPGDALVQLGAYNTLEDANAAWQRLRAENSDLLGGLNRFIETTESAGNTLYRLRAAGLNGVDENLALCAALQPRGVDCIAVTQQ